MAYVEERILVGWDSLCVDRSLHVEETVLNCGRVVGCHCNMHFLVGEASMVARSPADRNLAAAVGREDSCLVLVLTFLL